jgi:uncharacterized protein
MRLVIASLAFIVLLQASNALAQTTQPLRVLIVDGMNNHDWPRATKIVRQILESSGRFKVDVSTTPPTSQPADVWNDWHPDFARYDVILSNFNGGHVPGKGVHWSAEVQQSLERYIAKGGGLVIYHAANNSFPDWPAYNEMIGLGWRSPAFGPSVIIDSHEKIVTIPKGDGLKPGHGPEHDFIVTVLDQQHPITRGMPKLWLHPHDQLTHGQHGPAQNMTVLTCAYSKDTKHNEPMDWVVPYGKGRVYTTMLGHLWKDKTDIAMRCAGFQTLLLRGTEWAATGEVTIAIPTDFPTTEKTSTRQ